MAASVVHLCRQSRSNAAATPASAASAALIAAIVTEAPVTAASVTPLFMAVTLMTATRSLASVSSATISTLTTFFNFGAFESTANDSTFDFPSSVQASVDCTVYSFRQVPK